VPTDFFSVDTVLLTALRPLIYGAGHKACDLVRSDRFSRHELGQQQARNVAWELTEIGVEARFLIRDHDAKFGGGSDTVLESAGITVIRTPIAAPRANSHIERHIGSTRRECLDCS
jgi:putative transposase